MGGPPAVGKFGTGAPTPRTASNAVRAKVRPGRKLLQPNPDDLGVDLSLLGPPTREHIMPKRSSISTAGTAAGLGKLPELGNPKTKSILSKMRLPL